MSRTILVFGQKEFRITVPDDSRLTFGPWSPPTDKTRQYGESALKGTLRVYAGKSDKSDVLAVFSGVQGYRDLSLEYEEKTNIETGSVVWKSDKKGYYEEKKISYEDEWDEPIKELNSGEEDAGD